MERFEMFEAQFQDLNKFVFKYENDVKCPDCNEKLLCVLDQADGTKRLVCVNYKDKKHNIKRIYRKSKPCPKCACPWITFFSWKQTRSLDEGNTDKYVCLAGHDNNIVG